MAWIRRFPRTAGAGPLSSTRPVVPPTCPRSRPSATRRDHLVPRDDPFKESGPACSRSRSGIKDNLHVSGVGALHRPRRRDTRRRGRAPSSRRHSRRGVPKTIDIDPGPPLTPRSASTRAWNIATEASTGCTDRVNRTAGRFVVRGDRPPVRAGSPCTLGMSGGERHPSIPTPVRDRKVCPT